MNLSTERLIIRDLRESNYPEFERTLNEVQKSAFGGGKSFLNWLISQYPAMDIVNGLICFGVFDRKTRNLVGTIGVGRHDDLHEPEICYYMPPEYRGNGFATESVVSVTRWTLENYGIPYIIGTAGVDNVKSQRVLERSGYQLIDTRSLLVHATNERHGFKYYRYYAEKRA